MAQAITVSGTKLRQAATISGTGFANNTQYRLTITVNGTWVSFVDVTSDGSGAWSATWPVSELGSFKVDARPLTEHKGSTTAGATVTATMTG